MLRLGISITNLSIRSPLQTLARMSMIKKMMMKRMRKKRKTPQQSRS
jgi:hypothetical protein